MLPQYLIPLLKSTTFVHPETQDLTLTRKEVFKSYEVSRTGLYAQLLCTVLWSVAVENLGRLSKGNKGFQYGIVPSPFSN